MNECSLREDVGRREIEENKKEERFLRRSLHDIENTSLESLRERNRKFLEGLKK